MPVLKLILAILLSVLPLTASAQKRAPSEFYVGVDWLYWQSALDGLHGGDLIDDFPDPELKRVFVEAFAPTFNYHSGVRGVAGYALPNWDFNCQFTYLPNRATPVTLTADSPVFSDVHSVVIVLDTINFPLLQSFGALTNPFVLVRDIYENWTGKNYIFDALCGPKFFVWNRLQLEPQFGFRGAWSKQTVSFFANFSEPFINDGTSGSLDITQQFQGYGLKANCPWDCHVCYGLSLWGNVGGSLLYSQFKTKQTSANYIGATTVFLGVTTDSLYLLTPTLEFAVGLQYTNCLCSFPITFHVGWEEEIFFNFNHLSREGGNFSASGLILGGAIGF